ncbi:MAG TPA: FAD-dependent oxidoreductase [Mycobacteriales bacterium]|nr:FAD-dependent oxidoreductase [Mycobacteriales bacterium]
MPPPLPRCAAATPRVRRVRVAVVGAGVVGLTAALRLAEAGHVVRVVAARPPAETTSAVAAALWYPYRALPQDRVTAWSAVTYRVLRGLVREPAAGVRLRAGRELLRQPAGDPWWRDAVPDLDRVPPAELPPGYADGYRLLAPVVDMSVHLPWLVDRLAQHGVPLEVRPLDDLDAADPDADVVVDAAGLGAGPLAGDGSLVPVRGQVVVVEQVGVEEWLLDQTDPAALAYVVPRERTVVLGGTAQVGATGTEPDPATAREVVARCARLVPAVAGARVVAHRVGLRPTRPSVRLEAGVLPSGRPVVHDYGHGGAGVTLAWGCAEEVVRLVG